MLSNLKRSYLCQRICAYTRDRIVRQRFPRPRVLDNDDEYTYSILSTIGIHILRISRTWRMIIGRIHIIIGIRYTDLFGDILCPEDAAESCKRTLFYKHFISRFQIYIHTFYKNVLPAFGSSYNWYTLVPYLRRRIL